MYLANKKRLFSPIFLYLLMVSLGLISGFSSSEFLHSLGSLISTIFIKLFSCISMPIVALSLIVTLSTYKAEDGMQKMWKKGIFYTLSTTLFAALVACLLYLAISPVNAKIALPNETLNLNPHQSYMEYIVSLIPSSFFTPFLEHQVISVLLLGIAIGIAIRYIPDEQPRVTLQNFFQGFHKLFLILTSWLIAILPIGLFGFITTTIVELHKGISFDGIGQYLIVLVLANLIQGFVVLPLWLKLNNMKPLYIMKKMFPALSVAFFSKSSVGTLPITMKTAEQNLKIDTKISRFILPLCTNINMNGCAAFIFITVVYLMQNNGIPITYTTMFTWVVISTIAAIGNAGVPMGCFFLSASLLTGMNIPINLLGFILPFYSLIDMIETTLNVWSDSCVAVVIDQKMNTVIESNEDKLLLNTQ